MPREVVGVGGRRFAARPGLSIDGCAGRAASGAAAAAGRRPSPLEAARRRRAASKSTTRQPRTPSAAKDSGVQVGCPKTPVKGRCRAKAQGGSVQLKSPRCDTPTTTPPLSRTNENRRVACVGKNRGHHRENFTGCTRRPCLKRRRGSCPSSPARCRSSPRTVRSRRRPRITR